MINGVDGYVRNAIAMWTAMLPDAHVDRRLLRVDRSTGTRVILREPLAAQALAEIGRISPKASVVLEDVFGNLDSSPLTPESRMLRMPVMNRPAGMVGSASPGMRVVEVADQDTLAEAEQVMVDGFPFPSYHRGSVGRHFRLACSICPAGGYGWRTCVIPRLQRRIHTMMETRRVFTSSRPFRRIVHTDSPAL